ncbi:MAG: hypothetical protein A4E53_02637 [Pelotomaculum sp. PtaB.Bin104]|nr:MAG: hypothetical protein A4E53_02637 [Pelotomaculum sp. PtaB.Bin104]
MRLHRENWTLAFMVNLTVAAENVFWPRILVNNILYFSKPDLYTAVNRPVLILHKKKTFYYLEVRGIYAAQLFRF